MARNKKGASTPRGGNGARGGRGGRGGRVGRGGQAATRGYGRPSPGLAYIPFIGDSAGFTLADEARQTSQHDHSAYSNLRQRPVKFVSAGPSEPLKQLDELLDENNQKQAEKSTPDSPLDDPSPCSATPDLPKVDDEISDDEDDGSEDGTDDEESLIGPEELEAIVQSKTAVEEEPSFFFDLKGDQQQEISARAPVHIPNRPSSRDSSSSDEVILFKGRDAQRKVQPTISMTQMRTEIQVVEDQMAAGPSDSPRTDKKKPKRMKPRQRRKMRSTSNDVDDAILADYIANMRENGDADDILGLGAGNRRELGGTDFYVSDDLSSDEEDMNVPNAANEGDADGTTRARNGDSTGEDEDGDSESEIDEEMLAKLIAGQELGMDEDVQLLDSLSDSSSASGKEDTNNRINANDDFDVMDWERPSLNRRKGKAARAQINFNVSDSELEQTLQVAWKSDRLKKSERKKHREQLRALGMLGKKANPEDLRVKYPDGMNMEQVADEFQAFLLGSDEVLTLPPMDNHARKMIHDLADKFKIKSKSTGKADQRRPTLHRTLRTLPYVEATFNQAVNRINRRYFPRLDIKGKRSQRAPPPTRSNDAAATYRDGEIIGGAAPELGTDNRGRAMLEKMGWSSGTALGTADNKGILQPVTQAMKRSKAGLG